MMTGKIGFSTGSLLLFIYLIEGIVGKSRLGYYWGPTWQVHEAMTVLLTVTLLSYLWWAKYQHVGSYLRDKSQRIVELAALSFIGWGFVSCASQEAAINNIICFAVFAGMIMVLGISAQVYLRNTAPEKVLELITLSTGLAAVGCIVAWLSGFGAPVAEGRLTGIYNNPITAARMITLSSLLLLWMLISSKKHRKLVWTMLVLSVVAVFLTRTRTNIAALMISSIVLAARSPYRDSRRSARFTRGLFFVSLLGLALSLSFVSPDDVTAARAFLRVDMSVKDVPSDRMQYWEKGIQDLTIQNVFGQGYLAAFGGGGGGFEESNYDVYSNRHNILFSCAQSYGVVGLSLFCIFLAAYFYRFVVHRTAMAALGLAVLAYSLITGLTGNCLLSFGDPADRLAWFLIGICSLYADRPMMHVLARRSRCLVEGRPRQIIGDLRQC